MKITYPGAADDEQRGWLSETLAASKFDWTDITTNINVLFTDPPDENEHDDLTTFAFTDNTYAQRDPCGRPDFTWMYLRPNLADFVHDFGIPEPRHPDSPLHSAIDTIHHELGHVVAAKLAPSDVSLVGNCFGRDILDWWDEKDQVWANRTLEAFCETFKDLYLGPNRQWNNRTNLRLRYDKFSQFCDILDRVCACAGSGVPPNIAGEWVWVDAGAGGFAEFVGPDPPAPEIVRWGENPAAEQAAWDGWNATVSAGDKLWFEWDFSPQGTRLVLSYDFADTSQALISETKFTAMPGSRRGRRVAVAPADGYVRFRPVLGESTYQWGTTAGTRGFLYTYRAPAGSQKPCTAKQRPAWPYSGDPPPDPDPPPPPPPPPPTQGTRIFTATGGVRRFGSRIV